MSDIHKLNNLFEIKKFRLPAIFFTDRKKIDNFPQIINNLPKNSIIIIREYDLEAEKREVFAKNIINLAKKRNLKVIIGKDIFLAKKLKADGVHFSDFDQIPLNFRRKNCFFKGFIRSFACHSEKSLIKALALKTDINFISPAFPTTSHFEAKAFGLLKLAKITLKYKKASYICALGGVNSFNIKSIRKLDLSGFAAIEFFRYL